MIQNIFQYDNMRNENELCQRKRHMRNLCKDDNYTLVEIPYTMKDDEIIEILNAIKV